MNRDYLLEIGCEEIPAGFVGPALWNGGQKLSEELGKARLAFDRIDLYGTPRRLAWMVRGLAEAQAETEETVLGPPRSVAFGPDGAPTKAAEGFARSQGVAVSDLKVFPGEKGGEYLGIVRRQSSRPAAEVLPALAAAFVPSVPFRKSMRWADLDVRFARPVHWIVSLFGEEEVPFAFGSVTAGRATRGHRFLAPGEIPLASPAEYASKLAAASVLVDVEDRKKVIRDGLAALEVELGLRWIQDDPLVETVCNLVEFPVVLHGAFEERFLPLPKDILVTSMRNNQKYFVFEDGAGNLSNRFAFVSNMVVTDPRVVVAGNERVLRARLSDAEFYYGDDLKVSLFDRAQALRKVLFQADMGTYYEKVERLADVAGWVASRAFPSKEADCRRAAVLSKSDLTTGVVKEFPELQGVMGAHYAGKTGETAEVALSVLEHYLPKGQGDALPSTDVGTAVALADKIDMVCGCFGVGLVPTGTADPYALRRMTLGILQILEARGLRVPIGDLVDRSLETLAPKLKSPAAEVREKVLDFFAGRIANLWTSQGAPADLVDAVLAPGLTDVVDLRARLDAFVEMGKGEHFAPLAEAFRRAINISKGYAGPAEVSPALFEHPEEGALLAALDGVAGRVEAAARTGAYGDAFRAMASVQPAVAAFFEKVLVMAKDEQVRNNRLALLARLSGTFSRVADFTRVAAGQSK